MATTIINPYRFIVAASSTFMDAIGDGNDLTTYTFSGVNIGAANASRFVVAAPIYRATGSGTTISSVTIGGGAATQAIQAQYGASGAGIYARAAPTGTTADIVVTLSAGAVRCAIGVWVDLDMANAVADDTATAQNSTELALSAVTVNSGRRAYIAAYLGANSSTTFSGNAITQRGGNNYVFPDASVYGTFGDHLSSSTAEKNFTLAVGGAAQTVAVAAAFN